MSQLKLGLVAIGFDYHLSDKKPILVLPGRDFTRLAQINNCMTSGARKKGIIWLLENFHLLQQSKIPILISTF